MRSLRIKQYEYYHEVARSIESNLHSRWKEIEGVFLGFFQYVISQFLSIYQFRDFGRWLKYRYNNYTRVSANNNNR